jgi:hypothetical protein
LLIGTSTLGFAARASALAQPSAGSVVLFGSSSMNGVFGHLIANELEDLGLQVVRKGYSSAGLARPDFRDLPQILEQFPIKRRSTSVLLYIGGNDAQSLWLRPEERASQDEHPWVYWRDARWSGIYERRMVELINSLCDRGAQYTFVLPPADVQNPRLQSRLERVRKLQQKATKASKCGKFVSTTGDRERFELDGEPLRAPDGVHMNRSGAHVVWARVREQVLGALGYAGAVRAEARSKQRPRVSSRAKREERAAARKRSSVLLTDVR